MARPTTLYVRACTARVMLEHRPSLATDWRGLAWFNIDVPTIAHTPANASVTEVDTLRALLRVSLDRALRGDLNVHTPAGYYRIAYNGEDVVDLWNGSVLVGCDSIKHDTYCGVFACIRPR